MIAILVLFALGISISSYFPDNSEEYEELKNLLSPIDDYKTEVTNWDEAKNALVDFNYWFELIPRFNEIDSTDDKIQSLKNNVIQKITKLQLRMLPKIREFYTYHLSEILADDKYKLNVYSFGRSKVIGITHKRFRWRTGIEKFHIMYLNELKILGFNEIRYKWVESENDEQEKYVKYNFTEIKDNELRKFTLAEIEEK